MTAVFLQQEAFDYNNFVRQVRALAQGYPQLVKTTPLVFSDTGFTVTGTGNGVAYVAAGANMAVVPFRLDCTLGGGDGVATFNVIENFGVTPVSRGTLTAGTRFIYTDTAVENEIIVRTTVNWIIGDTIDFTMAAGTISTEAWVEDRFTVGTPDINGDFSTEWMSAGPSIGGGDAINCGMRTEFDFATSRHNVALSGADGFVSGSTWGNQPNNSPLKYLLTRNQNMPFWVVVTGDYITGFVRGTPGVYESFFLGFIDIFGTPGNHPKPILIGGSASNPDYVPSETNLGHSAFWDPYLQVGGAAANLGSMTFRWVDGTWLNFWNRDSGGDKVFAKTRWIQPYVNQATAVSDTSLPQSVNWNNVSERMVARSSGRYMLRPLEMFITTPQNAVIGQIPAWKFVSGFGLAAEDTIEDTSPVANLVACPNTFNTGRDQFAALQLDV